MPDASSALPQAIAALSRRESLSESLAAQVFAVVMRGDATPVQMAALLLGLRAKGETPEEVAGAARALRESMVRVEIDAPHLVDTCGTGGGVVSTFNISTTAALVAAGAGATVPKHGNRSFTSRCGSADVLEALGISIALDSAQATALLRKARIAFLFAPNFHPAVRHIGPVRKELGVTTVMNLLGPLANPAGVRHQVIGVADPERGPLIARALTLLGTEHALVVHGRVGMDEISPQGVTDFWEIRGDTVSTWSLDPATLGLGGDAAKLRGGEPAGNALRVEGILAGSADDAVGLAAVLLNAAAALYVAGLAAGLDEGVEKARAAIRSGAAREALAGLRRGVD